MFKPSSFMLGAVALLIVPQPGIRSALLGNVAHVLDIKAIQRPVARLGLNADRAAAVLVSQHLEHDIFTPSEQQSLAAALRFAKSSQAVSPEPRQALFLARLCALLGEPIRAREELEKSPQPDQRDQWTVLTAVLDERLGAKSATESWQVNRDASTFFFLDLSRYLTDRGDAGGADRSFSRAVQYAQSADAVYAANFRMALHKLYDLSDAETSLPYFQTAERQFPLVAPAGADEFGLRLSYGHALVNAHYSADAVVQLQRATGLNADRAHAAYELLGRAYLDSGRLPDAHAAYTTSLRLYARSHVPVSGYTYWGLGQTDLALGDGAGAKNMLHLALQSGVDQNLRQYIVELLADLEHSREP